VNNGAGNSIPYLKKNNGGQSGFGFGSLGLGGGRVPFQETGERIARYGKGFSNLLNLAEGKAEAEAMKIESDRMHQEKMAKIHGYHTISHTP
jgi:hypothetical protein